MITEEHRALAAWGTCRLGERIKVGVLTNLYGCIIGDDCTIGAYVEIQIGVAVGDRVKIGSHSFICSGVTIEDDVFIGHHVVTTNDKHPVAVRDGKRSVQAESEILSTVIERGASIGSGSVLLPVRVGAGAVIGAGSVVTKDVPAGETWIGNPAKRCRSRMSECRAAWQQFLNDTSLRLVESQLEDERKCAREFFTLKTKEAPVEPELIKCPKCGSDKVYLKYVKPEPSVVIGGTIKHHEQPERMKRECGRCGYYWHTPTADAKPLPSPNDRGYYGPDGKFHRLPEVTPPRLKELDPTRLGYTCTLVEQERTPTAQHLKGEGAELKTARETWDTMTQLCPLDSHHGGTPTTAAALTWSVGPITTSVIRPLEDEERRRKEMTDV